MKPLHLRLLSVRSIRAALGFALALSAPPASAQFQSFERPGERPLEAPEPGAPPEAPSFELPPVPEPGAEEAPRLSQGPTLVVSEFLVTGSTVFSKEELARVTEPYLGRPIGADELSQLADRLTRLYVDAGYRNSGATLPDQQIESGVVEYRIVEGRLTELEIAGNRWFRDGYLRPRILRAADPPLSLPALQDELQLLQQDERIRAVHAELVPGERPGEARLRVQLEEAPPYTASIQASNHESPSIGAYGARIDLGHLNLLGWGDELRGSMSITRTLRDFSASYEIPFTRWDTVFGARFEHGKSEVIEDPFADLEIESRSLTVGLELRQPLYRTLRGRLDLALVGERRKSETFLLGIPFPFGEGTDDGRSVVSVLRVRQDYLFRDLHQVVAARSMFSVGLDALGATMQGGGSVPEGRFFAWLGQFQWVRRIDPWGVEALLRTDVQLADSPLFSLEQFSLGGSQTVRGYREKQLVRDNGLVSSLELRIPVWSAGAESLALQLAPFVDYGRSWNSDRPELDPRNIYSVGIGLRWGFRRHLQGDVYWGHRLKDIEEPADHDLQDDGVTFQVSLGI
jgi:hemolysin activation/secretion protein